MDPTDYAAKLSLQNDTDRPRILWVEPLGNDYTALPCQTLHLYVWGNAPVWFNSIDYGEGLAVYIECDYERFEVYQGGEPCECGHNRQAAIDAGLRL